MKIAVVTGASSGLGREFVMRIAERGDVEEIWAIARREEKLLALKDACCVPVRVLPLDLTLAESFARLREMLEKEQPDIIWSVAAAGFGRLGRTRTMDFADLRRMVDLNCTGAMETVLSTYPYMHRGGKIAVIASTAAFQPFPYVNVYAATKAFAYRFTRALRVENLGQGIHITCVCPYWVKDTEFISVARQTEEKKAIRHFPLASKQKNVVKRAMGDCVLGLPVSTPGIVCTAHRVVAKFVPGEMMMGLWALIRRV